MSLSTLSAIKAALGISDTAQDTKLSGLLRAASSILRGYLRSYIGGLISANSLANPTVITSIGHGLATGDTIVIGGSNCTPTIDGSRVVTVLTTDTFTVPVNVTVAGTQGFYSKTLTEYACGRGDSLLPLKDFPILSVTSVYLDDAAYFGDASDAFAASTLLTSGEDYATAKPTGILVKIGGNWPNISTRSAGLLAAGVADGIGNVKVIYTPGYAEGVPADIQQATNQLVSELLANAETGGGMQAESVDYYSYSRASASEQAQMLSSVKGMLARYSGRRIAV